MLHKLNLKKILFLLQVLTYLERSKYTYSACQQEEKVFY